MITVYTLENPEEWDKTVKSFARHDVYYLSGYVRAFWINGDGEPILVYYENAGTRAINVVMKRDLAGYGFFSGKLEKGACYDNATPYGYGGFLVEGGDYGSLQEEYVRFCEKEHIVCEFVRFHPLLENWKGLEGLYEETCLGETVYMETKSEEEIWQNMTSKNRNMVRKAQKNGLKAYWGRDPELIAPFMELYHETMDKDCAAEYYYFRPEFYESILEDLKENGMWFYVKKEKEIAAIAVFMFCNGTMHYHLSASSPLYQRMAPGNLLLYEAALWACANGYQRLHLGGGVGSGRDGLYRFKKAFHRGEDLKFYIGKAVFDRGKYEELVQLRSEADPAYDRKTGYFPAYRG